MRRRTTTIIIMACVALLGAEPSGSRERCYEVLTAALQDESQSVRAHAAEALVLSNRPESALKVFRPLADTAEEKYRVVVWRMLARAEPDAAVRRQYIERIRRALLDRAGPDHTHAMEALAKLEVPPADDAERTLIREVADGGGETAPFALWRLAHAKDPTAADRLEKLLSSPNAVTRARAAYVLSRIGEPSPACLTAIANALKTEPADSPARDMLRLAQGHASAREMLADPHTPASGRYLAGLHLVDHATAADRPVLTKMLDDPAADPRIAAAFALLRLDDRTTSPATRPEGSDDAAHVRLQSGVSRGNSRGGTRRRRGSTGWTSALESLVVGRR